MGSDNLVYYVNFNDLDNENKNKIREWRNQIFVRKNMDNISLISEKEHKHFLESIKNNNKINNYLFFFNNKPIGIGNIKEENDKWIFGYYLIDEKFLNFGYGSLIEYVILNLFFQKNKFNNLFVKVKKNNNKVINMHKRFGFKEYSDFSNKDYIFLILTEEEWFNKKQNIRNVIEKIFKINLDEVREWKKN